MTRTASTTVTARLCSCGCGNPVSKAKSLYAPGHDARHAGLVAREAVHSAFADRMITDHLPTIALQAKARAMVERLQVKAQAQTVKAEAKAAVERSVEPVKVGRWTYPAMRKGSTLLRNTKRDGSGEWVAV